MAYGNRGRNRNYQGGRGGGGRFSNGQNYRGGSGKGGSSRGGGQVIEAIVSRSGRGQQQRVVAPRTAFVSRGGVQKPSQFVQRRGGSNFRRGSGQGGRFNNQMRGGQDGFRGRGRGGFRGRGRGRQFDKKPVSKADLDKDLDAYMFQDKETAVRRLDKDLDDYWSQANKNKSTADAKGDDAVPMES